MEQEIVDNGIQNNIVESNNIQDANMQAAENETNEIEIDISVASAPKEENKKPTIEEKPQQLNANVISTEQVEQLKKNGILLIPEQQLQMMLDTLSQSSNNLSQSTAGLEQSHKIIEELQDKLKVQKKLTKKFYQLEALALANKEALENILKSFDIASGWPTIEVFTAEGWVRGSVNYNLHNAMVLARAAIQSENLKVIESHLSGLNGTIKLLQQDLDDMRKLTNGKVSKCKFCNRMKVTDQVCWVCGKSDLVERTDDEDEDDDE